MFTALYVSLHSHFKVVYVQVSGQLMTKSNVYPSETGGDRTIDHCFADKYFTGLRLKPSPILLSDLCCGAVLRMLNATVRGKLVADYAIRFWTLAVMSYARYFLPVLLFSALFCLNSAYFVHIDAHAEECFFDKVTSGTKMSLMFEVAEGGFLDIDVKVNIIYAC